jgi:hypothetical protein
MTEQERFTSIWINEAKTTSKVLSRIPDGATYKPDPKSRTAQEIAWQIVCEEKMLIEAMETGNVAWAPPEMPASMQEVAAVYDQQAARLAERWKALPAIAGQAPSISSARRVTPRRWRGASCSTWCTIAARLRPTCGRWDPPCRRSTGPAPTSPRRAWYH